MCGFNIMDMQVNHVSRPLGYELRTQTFSWKYDAPADSAGRIAANRVLVAEDLAFTRIIHDSGMSAEVSFVSYGLRLQLAPRTRYYWKVETLLESGAKIESAASWFETGKMDEMWQGKWIGVGGEGKTSPIVRKTFALKKPLRSARAYMTGLGLYECCINGTLMNDGYLQPGFNNYNYWLQCQTMDITDCLCMGENVLSVMLGDGWYRGRFGVNGGFENNFGEHLHIRCEIHLCYEDGTEGLVCSDESFRYADGPVRFSNIYDGEVFDAAQEPEGWMQAGFDDSSWKPARLLAPERCEKLTDRYSLPVVVKERICPAALLHAPGGEVILDMGQNMTGWLVFTDRLKKGQQVRLRYAELLEDGALCTRNLLTAKAEFVYTSGGKERLVRPHFTYYGFRYVQLEGFEEPVALEDFEGWNLYSDMESVGAVRTGNEDVNRFIRNVSWSQRDNFLEHPTDCPQRSERLGWTGDAQIYFKTANYFMNAAAFFRKYMKDMNEEQAHRGGLVPFIIPKLAGRGFEDQKQDECSAAWSDAAVIIPWFTYVFYGDRELLAEQYAGMKAWTDYMIRRDEADGGKYLWQTGFHFGDWLALDNPKPGPFGKTDPYFIASCFYYYSTRLVARAAAVLEKEEDCARYGERAKKIRRALLDAYYTGEEICKIDTQTAYALTIYMEIVSERAIRQNGARLAEKLKQNGGHLDTGFVGTPYLCFALTRAGYHELACRLLLKDDYPSWLYQVKKGATTVWEAWDALDENGRLTGEASLNHYAYGSVAEWIYAVLGGIQPTEEHPGFAKARIAPMPSKLLGSAHASVDTQAGRYEVRWQCGEGDSVRVHVRVPFGCRARIVLQKAGVDEEVGAGEYTYEYCLR